MTSETSTSKMLIYHELYNQNLSRYGIDIPLLDERAQKTFEGLRQVFGAKIKAQDKIEQLSKEDLLLVHNKDFVERLFHPDSLSEEIFKCYELFDEFGRPYRYRPKEASAPLFELFDNLLKQGAGTYECCFQALENSFCYFLGGGMHHAMSFSGRGFCLFHDVVIAIKKLQKQKRIKTAWIIDVDAHKGDGQAQITQGDSSIKTLSVHMKSAWPLEGDKKDNQGNLYPWFIPSDIDIEIEEGDEHSYLARLEEGLKKLEKMGRPDLAIVVQGADPFEADELPSTSKLKLTLEQMLARDQLVFNFLKEKDIPQAYVMGGGYGKRTWEVYFQFLKYAFSIFREEGLF